MTARLLSSTGRKYAPNNEVCSIYISSNQKCASFGIIASFYAMGSENSGVSGRQFQHLIKSWWDKIEPAANSKWALKHKLHLIMCNHGIGYQQCHILLTKQQ